MDFYTEGVGDVDNPHLLGMQIVAQAPEGGGLAATGLAGEHAQGSMLDEETEPGGVTKRKVGVPETVWPPGTLGDRSRHVDLKRLRLVRPWSLIDFATGDAILLPGEKNNALWDGLQDYDLQSGGCALFPNNTLTWADCTPSGYGIELNFEPPQLQVPRRAWVLATMLQLAADTPRGSLARKQRPEISSALRCPC